MFPDCSGNIFRPLAMTITMLHSIRPNKCLARREILSAVQYEMKVREIENSEEK
jgi:hypothetical protein